MSDRTFTFVDLYSDLLMSWQQDKCQHFRLDFTKTYTKNNRGFWAYGICMDCGKNTGEKICWSE